MDMINVRIHFHSLCQHPASSAEHSIQPPARGARIKDPDTVALADFPLPSATISDTT